MFDLRGERVRRLLESAVQPGEHRLAWDGRDEAGRRLASGVYFCRLEISGFKDVRKMILVK